MICQRHYCRKPNDTSETYNKHNFSLKYFLPHKTGSKGLGVWNLLASRTFWKYVLPVCFFLQKGQKTFLKLLCNGVLFLIYYFKNHFKPCFSILKAFKAFLVSNLLHWPQRLIPRDLICTAKQHSSVFLSILLTLNTYLKISETTNLEFSWFFSGYLAIRGSEKYIGNFLLFC